MKTGQAVSEKKPFEDFMILYRYIAQGQRQITPGKGGEGRRFLRVLPYKDKATSLFKGVEPCEKKLAIPF